MIRRKRSTLVGLGSIIVLLFSVHSEFSQQAVNWTTQADSLRGRNGQQFTYACPGNGTLSPRLWGTDVYTDDSSICTAAVHAGLIAAASGGSVTIEIRPGQARYEALTRNGVTSRAWGQYAGSFVFVGRVSDSATINWTESANSLRGRNGQRFTYVCPAGGPKSERLWGTNLYTDDSSICTAAAHAGLFSIVAGGTVTVEIRPGASSYAASTRNGVVSKSYGSYPGSFVIVGGHGATEGRQISWSADVTAFRGQNGQRFTFLCSAAGSVSGRLWGTDLYTDDSSVCTAAVHAGMIKLGSGGTITIEIRPGVASYQGTTRNGVASSGYGPWSGSFVFVR